MPLFKTNHSPPILFAKRGVYERFRSTTKALNWKWKGETVLLGLSGGRDSVTLLHLLLVSGHRVVAAHLNHQLRGRESVTDEKFVRRLCSEWNVPVVVERADVAARARRQKLSIEEAARIVRYLFLERVARRKKLRKVVVAHHQSDQAETVLLKVLLGANRHELRGMKLCRPFPSLRAGAPLKTNPSRLQLIRPLLETPSSEISRYVRQNRLVFREDSSNRDLSRPRNWIRHRLLPLIERRLNRNVMKTLARLGSFPVKRAFL